MDTLVLGSGGIKGFCQLGACKAFFEGVVSIEDINVFVGCSVGSILSVMLACGYTPTELLGDFLTMDVEGLLRIGNLEDMIKHAGVFDQEPIRRYLRASVAKKLTNGDLGFREFYEVTGRDLYIVGVNTDQTEKIVFCRKNTPETPVIEGIVASCSIPFVIQGTELENSIVVDGAAMDPVGLDVAIRVSPEGGRIYCIFFCGRGNAEKFLSLASHPSIRYQGLLGFWGRSLEQTPPGPSTLDALFTRGKKVFRCFIESLLENYIFRHILENQFSELPRKIRLIPLPAFHVSLFASPEMKVHMYYTGVDILEAMIDQKYLP